MDNFWLVANFILFFIQIILFIIGIYQLFSYRKENIKIKKINLLERYIDKFRKISITKTFLELKSQPEILKIYNYISKTLEFFYYDLNFGKLSDESEKSLQLFYSSLINVDFSQNLDEIKQFLIKIEKTFINYMMKRIE